MGIVKSNWSKWAHGRQVFYDGSNGETLQGMYPIQFYDDFLGEAYNTTLWGTTETNLNTAIALDDDTVNGVLEIIVDRSEERRVGKEC